MVINYKIVGKEEGFKALEYFVILNDFCSGCSICQAVCPEDVIKFDEYPYLDGNCTKCGYCLEVCPRCDISRKEIEKKLFGKYETNLLGYYKKIIAMKTNIKGQDGGAVTYILKYLLENDLIDAALVTFHEKQKAYPKIVTNADDVVKAAGTKYTMSNVLYLLKDSLKYERVAVVALPCQIEAIRKFQFNKVGEVDLTKNIKLIIGLFCKSNFLYELFTDLIGEKYSINLDSIRKVDIKGKYFYVYLPDGVKKIPLKEVRRYKRFGCNYCIDFPARMADLSVGSVGSDKGYSTIIIRTENGEMFLDKILKQKDIDLKENVDILSIEKLSKLKFDENIKEVKNKIISYLPFHLKHLGDLL